ncbi:DUF2804 domain-containing protein [Salinibacterium sp. ZJ454]|uniref:DUF2804 domain-containing protein n=1 Tax=Salinibacterium sp. ZJ454 TaxID=2708339 RepID=UPI00141F68B0|nr:DUF2804 domain-containing protein [Salinibacterium sp. ZJ454]
MSPRTVVAVPKRELEITQPVDLCLPNGRLNPEAVGWTRTPLIRTNVKRWGRVKRFEYWAISTPQSVFAFSIGHADYRTSSASFHLDRAAGSTTGDVEARWFPPAPVNFPESSGREVVTWRGKRINVTITPGVESTRIQYEGEHLRADIRVLIPETHESMAVVVPWSDKCFQYTRKDNSLHCEGWIERDGQREVLDPETALAALDHGRGIWPVEVLWNWCCGHGVVDGHEIGLQFGAKWTDGTPSTENSIRIDGRVYKISEDVQIDYDPADFMRPWRFSGAGVELVFTPEYNRHAPGKRSFPMSREDQAFGTYEGHVTAPDGTVYRVADVFGWAEEVHRRW